MGDCFRWGESLGLCIAIFCLLPTNCIHIFFVWILSVVVVVVVAVVVAVFTNVFCAMGQKIMIVIREFTFPSRKTNLLNFNIKICT